MMKGFLLVYYRPLGRLLVCREYDSFMEGTMAAYELAQHRTDKDTEIVCIGGHSLQAIKRSHSRYFPAEPQEELPQLAEAQHCADTAIQFAEQAEQIAYESRLAALRTQIAAWKSQIAALTKDIQEIDKMIDN